MKIKELIANGENSYVEFKLSLGNKVIETLVAFANTKGGKVVVGKNNMTTRLK